VGDRSKIGHWKADHMIGWRNLMSHTERVTRAGILITMSEGYGADGVLAGLREVRPHPRPPALLG
jgi:IS30 family transposase